jgi:hypothetical protein
MEARLEQFSFCSDEFLVDASKNGSLLKLTTLFIPQQNMEILKKIYNFKTNKS